VTRIAKPIVPLPIALSNNSFPDTDWQTLLAGSLHSPDQLAAHLPVARAAIEQVVARYPMRINP
jgi:hypothetical protein